MKTRGKSEPPKTNASGYYVFPNLLVGTYTLSAESSGFKKSVQTGIRSQFRHLSQR